MTFDEDCLIASKIVAVAGYFGVPYADDISAGLALVPQIEADAKQAVAIFRDFCNGKPGQLLPKHIDAINAVHAHFSTYANPASRNPHSPLPQG